MKYGFLRFVIQLDKIYPSRVGGTMGEQVVSVSRVACGYRNRAKELRIYQDRPP